MAVGGIAGLGMSQTTSGVLCGHEGQNIPGEAHQSPRHLDMLALPAAGKSP